jgi:hypothetical protein
MEENIKKWIKIITLETTIVIIVMRKIIEIDTISLTSLEPYESVSLVEHYIVDLVFSSRCAAIAKFQVILTSTVIKRRERNLLSTNKL